MMTAATAIPPISNPDKDGRILVARGLTKTFPGVKALEHVNFDIRAGEVNALVGENGAGKSTLIKLLSGLYSPDSGEILIDGMQMEATPSSAHRAGIATIHQDAHLVPNMSVAENIMLGHWPARFGVIDRRAQAKRAAAAIAMVAPQLSPATIARQLSPAEGQLVEIARAISERSRILIMDEPTTSLSMREIDNLFSVVDELRQRGMGIVFVSHWLEEVFRIADRITVLRDARNVDSLPANQLDAVSVVKLMVGRDVQSVVATSRPAGRVILNVENLTRTGVLDNVNLTVSAGEVVTLAGLVGAGRTELARCIFGIDPYDVGTVILDGAVVSPGFPRAAIDAGIGLVPEDRRQEALVGGLSVSTNATLAALREISPGGFLSERREDKIRQMALQSVAIKMASHHAPISTLSGGNQQKVVIGRWLALKPKLLILDEPTKGIDIKSKAEISEIIIKLAEQGTAILLISSEMPEVLSLSDRVVVMRSGRAVGELRRGSITAEAVMHLATSG